MAWTCPDCGRSFGAEGRQHMCQPGLTLDEFFADAHPVFDAIAPRLESLDGDLIIDPVRNRKILFKNGPTFLILESKTRWVALGFTLRRKLDSPRLSRKVAEYQGNRYHHVVNLAGPADVDEQLLDWLTEAFYRDELPPSDSDSMIPDDIDEEFSATPCDLSRVSAPGRDQLARSVITARPT